jgi:prolyl-tRNA synthetase
VVVIPIFRGDDADAVLKYCEDVQKTLRKAGLRVHLDKRDDSPGWKYNYWEMKGVPIRVEVGPRDLKGNKAVLFRRDTMERVTIDIKDLKKEVSHLGTAIDKNLRAIAEARFEGLIVDADSFGTIEEALDHGKIARIPFCTTEMEGLPCDEEIKERTGGEVRGTRIDVEEKPEGVCVVCGKVATEIVYIARSY